jgi:hypothetical protein
LWGVAYLALQEEGNISQKIATIGAATSWLRGKDWGCVTVAERCRRVSPEGKG